MKISLHQHTGRMIKPVSSLLILLLCVSLPAFAGMHHVPQSRVVTGKVSSVSDNQSVPGASVLIKGTSAGTVTDADGKYSIEVQDGNAVLVISAIGFESEEVLVGEKTIVDVSLSESMTALQEVVVVGYGVQQKLSVTNAMAEVKGDELVNRPVTNISQAMQGKLPGVTILDRGGSPGNNNSQILVRGVNRPYTPVGLDQTQTSTVENNGPLVIVDGIEQPFSSINPADIESVTVLKDASSAAIYGSRAGNGVILITTKRAKSGKVQVSYSGFYAVQKSLTQPKPMDIESYLRLQNVAYANVNPDPNAPPHYTEDYIQQYVQGSKTNPLKYPLPYNWYSTMLHSAPQVNNTVSVSGGSDNIRARFSLRHQDQGGIIANTSDKLNEIRLSTDMKMSEKISLSADVDYRNQNTLQPHDITNIFRLFMQNAIWAVPKYPNGDYGGGTQGNSPLLLAEKGGYNRVVNDYVFGALKGDWQIVKGLKFTSQLALRSQNTAGKDFTNTWQTKDSTTVKKSNLINSLTESRTVDKEITWNNLLNYDLKAGDHTVHALAGYSQIYHQNSTISAYRQQFYNNDVQSLGQGANDATKNNGGADYTWGLRSYFGRVNYSFKDKYLFEANGRFDGSSRFTGANKYSFFPSFSGGWRIAQENFFSDLQNTVSDLKLRASWGRTGNQTVPLYSYYANMTSTSYAFNNVLAPGYEQRVVADPSITWETTTQTDIGMDGELFNGKLTLSVDYYNKTTSGILLSLPVPGAIGLQGGPRNAGTIENKGWEFVVGSRNQFGKFRLTTALNFAINSNKVTSLAGTGPYIYGNDIDPRYITGVGYPVNAFWGYQTAGLYQTQAEADAAPQFMRPAKAGDVKMVDRSGDGQIGPADMTYLGNSFPKYIFGGTINLAYGPFALNVALQGAADVKMRIARALGEAGNYEGFTPDIYTNNYWTPEHTDARFARPTKNDLRNQASTDRMLVDASYLRVKNVQLSYQLPSALLNKISLERASLYFSATNLLTFSKLNEWHLDPESSSGWQNYYPQTRLYTLGLNLQF